MKFFLSFVLLSAMLSAPVTWAQTQPSNLAPVTLGGSGTKTDNSGGTPKAPQPTTAAPQNATIQMPQSASLTLDIEDRGYALGHQSVGAKNATVTVVEYFSLTCPHCAEFHIDVFPRIKKSYIDNGKVRFEFHEVYFDQLGLFAAVIARCGGEHKYHGFIDLMMRRQSEWVIKDQKMALEGIKKIGRLGGLTDARMDQCLADTQLQTMMTADYNKSMRADGIESTPTFLISGKKTKGAMSLDEMKAELDKHLQ